MWMQTQSPIHIWVTGNHNKSRCPQGWGKGGGDIISNWASEWLVKFSPSKTKIVIIRRKRKGAKFPPLRMNYENLEEVQLYKQLGITFTKTLNSDEHIENLMVKANHCMDVLNALKYKLEHNTVEKL